MIYVLCFDFFFVLWLSFPFSRYLFIKSRNPSVCYVTLIKILLEYNSHKQQSRSIMDDRLEIVRPHCRLKVGTDHNGQKRQSRSITEHNGQKRQSRSTTYDRFETVWPQWMLKVGTNHDGHKRQSRSITDRGLVGIRPTQRNVNTAETVINVYKG